LQKVKFAKKVQSPDNFGSKKKNLFLVLELSEITYLAKKQKIFCWGKVTFLEKIQSFLDFCGQKQFFFF
jgi:hypothetical protein